MAAAHPDPQLWEAAVEETRTIASQTATPPIQVSSLTSQTATRGMKEDQWNVTRCLLVWRQRAAARRDWRATWVCSTPRLALVARSFLDKRGIRQLGLAAEEERALIAELTRAAAFGATGYPLRI